MPTPPKVLTENWRCMTLVSLSNNYSPKELYILGDLVLESSHPIVLPSYYVHPVFLRVILQVTVTLDIPFWWILKPSGRPTWVQQSIQFWQISSFRYHSVLTTFVSLQEVLSTLSPKIYLTPLCNFFFLREFESMDILPFLSTLFPLKILVTVLYLFIYHIDFIVL